MPSPLLRTLTSRIARNSRKKLILNLFPPGCGKEMGGCDQIITAIVTITITSSLLLLVPVLVLIASPSENHHLDCRKGG